MKKEVYGKEIKVIIRNENWETLEEIADIDMIENEKGRLIKIELVATELLNNLLENFKDIKDFKI